MAYLDHRDLSLPEKVPPSWHFPLYWPLVYSDSDITRTCTSSKVVILVLVLTHFYPSALQAGGVLSSRSSRAGRRAGSCQTCGTHISVTAWRIFSIQSSVELSRPVVVHCRGHLPHLSHTGLPMGQKLVKFATNWVQTLQNAYLWSRWMDLPHLTLKRLGHFFSKSNFIF